MKQATFFAENEIEWAEVISLIASDPAFQERERCLIILHEANTDETVIRAHLTSIGDRLPGMTVTGITQIGPLDKDMILFKGAELSVISFETSEFRVFLYDCEKLSPEAAAVNFSKELKNIPDAKGILYYSSNVGLNPERFLTAMDSSLSDIPVFGTQAGASNFFQDDSFVFYHDACLRGAIVTVVFSGEDLSVDTNYCFGWRPLGSMMTVTETGEEGIVKTIDHEKATEIYYNYLRIHLDEHFYENVCAFPMVILQGHRYTSRVPFRYYPDGSIRFSTEMRVGDQLSLSYAKSGYLLKGTLKLANELLAFSPEALLGSACVNRRFFMGNEKADQEIDYLRKVCPSFSYGCGYGEILRTSDGGGFLNSTLVVAALREGPAPELPVSTIEESDTEKEESAYMPLADRLVTFLEATTQDLKRINADLQKLASRDQLTGLYNRMYMENALHEEMRKHLTDADFSVMMFDIDCFKHVNDTYGHQTGDMVLKRAAELLSDCLPDGDLASRWGGDEFLVLFKHPSNGSDFAIAEKFRSIIEHADFSPVPGVTVSVGLAGVQRMLEEKELLRRVDLAMYHSKHSGRNLVTIYEKGTCEDEMKN